MEVEAAAMAGASSPRCVPCSAGASHAPVIVHDALASPGRPLERSARSVMESRFGVSLAGVRIHTGGRAAEAARAVNAHAFTVGQEIVFAANRYDPRSREGQRLLAHELTHTIQQSGRSEPLLQRDPIPESAAKPEPAPTPAPTAEADPKQAPANHVTVFIPYQPFSSFFPFQPAQQNTPTGNPPGNSSGFANPTVTSIPPPFRYVPSSAPGPGVTPNLAPLTTAPPTGTSVATSAPDRLSFHDFGNLSIGGRMGFPDLTTQGNPGDPLSAAQQALKKAEILNFILNGAPPSEYQVDLAKTIGTAWAIFSNQIAPDLAKRIAAGMASKPKSSGPTYQLDATILFSGGSGDKTGSGRAASPSSRSGGGGGLSLTVSF
jgi:hypothetical protein